MFVTLAAVITALVLGHLAPAMASAVRRYGWYPEWLRWLDRQLGQSDAWRGRFGLAIALAPPLLAVGLFQLALHGPMLGFPGLLFGVVVLFYAWGPRDLDLDVEAIVDAPDAATRREAVGRLWPHGSTLAATPGPGALVEAVFRNALRRWFGVLFWFLLLGPVGALLYRLVAEAVHGEARQALPPGTAAGAGSLLALLDWPVAQLMTLSMALVGNFDTVLGAWKDAGGTSMRVDTSFLEAAGRASVRSELADEAQDYVEEAGLPAGGVLRALGELPELRDAMSVVWRILLSWLAVLALFVLAGWVT